MYNILLIDDDLRLGDLLSQYFQQFDMKIDHALKPSEGFKKLAHKNYDLIILDVMLPEMDGFEVCKEIRKSSEIPVLMLTARGEVTDRIVGIEIGADDYLPKPFEPRELVARIQSILKRSSKSDYLKKSVLRFEDMVINKETRQLMINNKVITLSSMEFDLLILLVNKPNKVFSRDEILNNLKGIETELFSRSVDIQISRLRQKIKPYDFIKTIRGTGYTFAAKES